MQSALARYLRALPRALPLALAAIPVLTIAAIAIALTDLAWLILGRRNQPRDVMPRTSAASLVIPNWNGRDLLERFLPS